MGFYKRDPFEGNACVFGRRTVGPELRGLSGCTLGKRSFFQELLGRDHTQGRSKRNPDEFHE